MKHLTLILLMTLAGCSSQPVRPVAPCLSRVSNTGSMYPHYRGGEFVAVLPVTRAELKPGMIVLTYPRWCWYPVIHRVVALHQDCLVTRGDANPTSDPPITYFEIIGRVVEPTSIKP